MIGSFRLPVSLTSSGDTTAPTITTATVEDANPDKLVVVFSEVVNIINTTGLTITGDATPTLSAPTGSGSNTITFTLSTALTNGQSVTLNVASSNTIEDAANNSLVATTKTITNNVAVATTQLLDTYSGGKAAYSLRSIKTGYAGELFTLRRDSDQVEQAFSLVNGEFPTSEILSFAGSGSAYGAKWNDITGNGMDAIQTTATLQPKLVDNGSIILLNGKPAWDFQDSHFVIPNSKTYFKFLHGNTLDSSAFVGALDPSSLTYNPIHGNTGGSSSNIGSDLVYDNRNSSNNLQILVRKGLDGVSVALQDMNTSFTNNQISLFTVKDLANQVADDRVTTKLNTQTFKGNTKTATVSTADATNDLRIGSVGIMNATYFFTGKMQELIFWDNDVTDAAQTDINGFYNTY